MKRSIAVLPILCAALASAADPPEPKFRAVEIDSSIKIGYGLAVADVNGDGKQDILMVDADQVVWYQNPTWTKHVIAEKLTEQDHVCIAARDVDGDGKAEVAVGAGWNPGDTVNSGSVHYLVAPEDRTGKWAPIRLPHEPTVHRMHWMKNWREEVELVVLPLHGRGNKDAQGAGVKMLAYSMPDDPKETWPTRVLSDSLHKTHNFDPVQWDDDPAEEPLIASAEGVFVVNWQDNELKQIALAGAEGGGAGEVRLGKLSSSSRFIATIEPMHGNSAVVYTRPAGDNPDTLWTRQVIDESIVDGHALACGDLLKIGRDQIVVGWRAMNRRGARVGVALYTPMDAQGKNWRKTLIDDNTMACEDLRVADLDGDGDLDIIAAGRATKNVKIYWNER